jgi:tRNA modification GTPase
VSARDTIVAIASPPGAGERGILRLSGHAARSIVASRAVEPWPDVRGVHEVRLRDAQGTQPALLLWMPGPRSYTREDVVELHVCGNPWLIDSLLGVLLDGGARRAEPGEFTRRAFESGRLDLTRAEGVLEQVAARNEAERRAAAALLDGGLSRRIERLRDRLDDVRALCEASLDFDETDTGHVPTAEIVAGLEDAASGLAEASGWEDARPPRSGAPRVMLVGAPNAGKSTLFNALSEQDAIPALVSELAGTTRDPLRVTTRLDSIAVELFDLAGLATTARDELDAAGQERARALLDTADLLVPVVRADTDASALPDVDLSRDLSGLPGSAPLVGVWSQTDLPDARPAPDPQGRILCWVPCSREDASSHARLAEAIARVLGRRAPSGALSRELAAVHRAALTDAREAVSVASGSLRAGGELDLVASSLRQAVDALDSLTGHTSPEDLLDRIFARFCLGK